MAARYVAPPGPYVTDDVLAGAYAGKNPPLKFLLTHTVAQSTGAPLCKRVKPDSMAGWSVNPNAPPTCPICLARDPRFNAGGAQHGHMRVRHAPTRRRRGGARAWTVAGQRVRIDMGRRGGVQEGTIVRLLPDGRFIWKNCNNYERTARPEQITEKSERAGKLDPYVEAWMREGDGNDE